MNSTKTIPIDSSVDAFLAAIESDERRKDCQALCSTLQKITQKQPQMWGSALVGFGTYHYKYASGHEGDTPQISFSPRKEHISIYFNDGFENKTHFLEKLGKYKQGKGCLNIKRLADVNVELLEQMMLQSFENISHK